MARGGKRVGAGRKPTYEESMPSVQVTARDGDFTVLRMLGNGNISEGVRALVDAWRRNDHSAYQIAPDDTLMKQVTIYTHPPRPINDEDVSGQQQRIFVDIYADTDQTTESFETEAEAIAYAQEVMWRELRSMQDVGILGRR